MSRSRPAPMDREPTSLPPAFPSPDPAHPRMRPLPPLGLQAGHVGEVVPLDESGWAPRGRRRRGCARPLVCDGSSLPPWPLRRFWSVGYPSAGGRIEELGGPCRPVCDTDQTCNGVCTFALRCRPEIGCVSETVTVAVGEKKVVTFYPMSPDGLPRPGSTRARLILRCRRHPPAIPCPVRCESDADCPRFLGDPCVQRVGGLCMGDQPCV